MEACDRVRISVLDENYIDMLLPDGPGIRRQGMATHFDPACETPLAENGMSLLVEVTAQGTTRTILFDAGLTSRVVLHNAALLGVDLASINLVVLSHGHPDHFGGLVGVLEAIGHPVPLIVHPDAFNPRFIVTAQGRVMPYINMGLTQRRLEEAGAGIVTVREPLPLAPGVTTSGQVGHTVDFEFEVPAGRLCINDGALEEDAIRDYQSMIINVRGLGLVVLDPCGHAGVISSLQNARQVSGISAVHAVMGGFHLGHAGISQDKIDKTVDSLASLGVRFVSPMHCSGFRAIAAVHSRLPDELRLMTAGTVVTFEAETD